MDDRALLPGWDAMEEGSAPSAAPAAGAAMARR